MCALVFRLPRRSDGDSDGDSGGANGGGDSQSMAIADDACSTRRLLTRVTRARTMSAGGKDDDERRTLVCVYGRAAAAMRVAAAAMTTVAARRSKVAIVSTARAAWSGAKRWPPLVACGRSAGVDTRARARSLTRRRVSLADDDGGRSLASCRRR